MGQQFFINPLCLGIVYTTHIVSFPICGKLEKRIISGFKKTLTSSPPEMVNVPFPMYPCWCRLFWSSPADHLR